MSATTIALGKSDAVAAPPCASLTRMQHESVRTLEMCVSASVTGLAGGRSQKWTLSGADPSGCALRRFRYMCSVKNGVNGDMTCNKIPKN